MKTKKIKAWLIFWPDKGWQVIPKRLKSSTGAALFLKQYRCEITYKLTPNTKE